MWNVTKKGIKHNLKAVCWGYVWVVFLLGWGVSGQVICAQGVTLADNDKDGFLDINFIEDLNSVRTNLDGRYELLRTLDFRLASSYRSGEVNSDYVPDNAVTPDNSNNPGWIPIGGGVEFVFQRVISGQWLCVIKFVCIC